MSFLTTILLVTAAVVLLVVGAVSGSSTFFVCAAIASAAAVLLLWRRAAAEKEHIFLKDSPTVSEPDWNRSLLRPDDNTEKLRAIRPDAPVDLNEAHELGIANYDSLVAAEVLPSLETLSVEQLRAVIAREQRGMRRASIVRRAQTLIEMTGVTFEPAQPSVATTRGPGRSTQRRRKSSLQKDGPDLSL